MKNIVIHKRKTIRLQNYNYSESGYYFVTVCADKRKLYFENDMHRKTIEDYWLKIPEQFQKVALDVYMIMPNHIHGIIFIVGAVHPVRYHISKAKS